eukprot:scaffold83100_cov60-Attheya_sp.AAC.2
MATVWLEEDGPSLSVAAGASLLNENLMLDKAIRDWVVLPLLAIMIAAGLLRHYMMALLKGATGKPVSITEARAKGCLQRSARLRGDSYILASKWEARRRYLSRPSTHSDDVPHHSSSQSGSDAGGYLREEAEWATLEAEERENNPDDPDGSSSAGAGGMDMMNPMSMMDGMKGQMAFMAQNMIMMQGISHFFQGYVLVKVPFPLTNGFKQMFQRGLDLKSLETSYVSSVSWYFLVMYGLRAFFRLVIGDPPMESMESTELQRRLGLNTNAPAGPQTFDAPKILTNEADHLEL